MILSSLREKPNAQRGDEFGGMPAFPDRDETSHDLYSGQHDKWELRSKNERAVSQIDTVLLWGLMVTRDVQGRSRRDWTDALQPDLNYVACWSLFTDTVLLSRTVKAVAQGRR